MVEKSSSQEAHSAWVPDCKTAGSGSPCLESQLPSPWLLEVAVPEEGAEEEAVYQLNSVSWHNPSSLRFPSKDMEITHCFHSKYDPGTCSEHQGSRSPVRCYHPAAAVEWHKSVQAATLVSKQHCLSMERHWRGSDSKSRKGKHPLEASGPQSAVQWYKWQTPLPSALGEASAQQQQQLQSSLCKSPDGV